MALRVSQAIRLVSLPLTISRLMADGSPVVTGLTSSDGEDLSSREGDLVVSSPR